MLNIEPSGWILLALIIFEILGFVLYKIKYSNELDIKIIRRKKILRRWLLICLVPIVLFILVIAVLFMNVDLWP